MCCCCPYCCGAENHLACSARKHSEKRQGQGEHDKIWEGASFREAHDPGKEVAALADHSWIVVLPVHPGDPALRPVLLLNISENHGHGHRPLAGSRLGSPEEGGPGGKGLCPREKCMRRACLVGFRGVRCVAPRLVPGVRIPVVRRLPPHRACRAGLAPEPVPGANLQKGPPSPRFHNLLKRPSEERQGGGGRGQCFRRTTSER